MDPKHVIRWLEGLTPRLQRLSLRMEEAGILLGDVDAEMTAIRKQAARWAERLAEEPVRPDPPVVEVPFEDADTNPFIELDRPGSYSVSRKRT